MTEDELEPESEVEEFFEDYFAEKRIPTDRENETIVFVAGYPKSRPGGWPSDRVWFCRITKDGLTVEDYATDKRRALRDTRKAWKKAREEKFQAAYGYPRVIDNA